MLGHRPLRPAEVPGEPRVWLVIGILTSGLLILSGWTSNLVPKVTEEPRLLGQHSAALIMCGVALVICAAIGWFTYPSPARKAARVMGGIAAAGVLWALANDGHSAWL